jgi:DNA-binding beta-propeller fold protein YncE
MRLYASQFDAGIVGEFNMSSKSHIRDISTPGTPQGIGLSADGTTLFVSKEGLQASLEIVDLVTNAREEINIGHGCFGLAVARDDTEVWLACPGEVVAVDLTSRTIRTTVPTGGYNRRIAFSVDGFTAVVTNDEGKVYFIQ